jgi:phosphoribosylaminoimidazole carboxylase PurE protein
MAKNSRPPRVGIVLGSDSDLEIFEDALKVLDELGIGWELVVASAHRTPERARRYAEQAEGRGLRVLIAGAGGAAALPGFLASVTLLPVIGVPINATTLLGLDSLLSMVQMPTGVPVATVAVGKMGASNAALLAAEIIALGDGALRKRLLAYRKKMAQEVAERSRRAQVALAKHPR